MASIDEHMAEGARHRREGRSEEAVRAYQAALVECRRHGRPMQLAHVARHLGDLLRENARYEEARPLLEEALATYREGNEATALDLANSLRPLALLRDAVGEPGEAGRLWRQARELYATSGVDEGVLECDARLAAADPR